MIIRFLIILFWVYVAFTLLKILYRFVVKPAAPKQQPPQQDRIKGEDMVQDPQCRTYIPKARAVTRRINGELRYFCSEACARQHEERRGT